VSGGVDDDFTGHQSLGGWWSGRGTQSTPQSGADAGGQLAAADRFDDVVVCPGIEPDDLVRLRATRGKDDHGDRGLQAKPTTDLHAPEIRQTEIQEDEIRPSLLRGGERLLAGRGEDDLVPFLLQQEAQRAPQERVVVD
jgi:hypothetical protein